MSDFLFIDPSVSTRLCFTLLHSLWQMAVLVGVAWLIQRWRPASVETQYSLHLAALCLGLIALPVTYLLVEMPSVSSVAEVRVSAVLTAPIAAASPVTENFVAETPDPTLDVSSSSITSAAVPSQYGAAASPIASTPASNTDPITADKLWGNAAPVLLGVYIIGVTIMVLRLGFAIWKSNRLVASSKQLTDRHLTSALLALANQWAMKVAPALMVTERIIVPQIVGLWRPVILLPTAAVTGMTTTELNLILTHEMAHLRRHDMWIHLLQRLAEIVLFFNPALWLLNRRISTLREFCCDDLTLESQTLPEENTKLKYATALLKTVEVCSATRIPATDIATLAADGHSPSELRRRIARLLGEPLREPLGISRTGLLAIGGAAALLLGPTLWTATQAAAPETPQPLIDTTTNDTSDDTNDDSAQTFSLKVVGPDGKGVANAQVQLRTNPAVTKQQILRGRYVKDGQYGNNATANENGELSFTKPKRPNRFNIKIQHPGFAPYWASWSPKQNGEAIPDRFTAELDAGWSVGGVVVDENGKPVEGVKIGLGVKHKMRPGDTSSMGVGTNIKTDAKGRWRFNCVPASKGDVHVEVSHPNFQPHFQRLAQDTFGIEAAAEPSEIIQLKQGLTVTGTITDEAGQPIAGALVRTKFMNDLRKAKTNKDGVYALKGCDEKMARIVVSAKGKATDLQTVKVDSDLEPVNFVMKPGGHVKIRVVDEAGKPIPKARIFYQRWRGGQAYWEFDHKRDYADENGVWEWNEAPLDEFSADICRPGGMQLSYQKLIAREQEYVFTPPKTLVVSGNVIDAKTKKPIRKFRVVPGTRDDSGFRPGLRWSSEDAFNSADGRYKVTRQRVTPAHLVRIEAEGYKVAWSRDIKSSEGSVTVDFALEPATKITVQLRTASGKPAVGAKVVVGIASNQISIVNGDIGESQTYAQRLRADANGRFSFPFRDERFDLVVTHESGFLHLKSPEERIPDIITLTPWASVEGIFRIGQKAISNVTLEAQGGGLVSYGDDGPRIFTRSLAKTANDGHYIFPRMFPGTTHIGRQIEFMVNNGATEVTSSVRQAATLVSGQTTTTNLGGTGRPVIGKLTPPTSFKEKVLWNFAWIDAEVDQPMPEPEAAPQNVQDDPVANQQWWEAWKETEDGKIWMKKYLEYERIRSESPHLRATVARDGSFKIDDVPTGKYVLRTAFNDRPGRPSPGSIRNYKFEVPAVNAGQPAKAVSLGTLQLE